MKISSGTGPSTDGDWREEQRLRFSAADGQANDLGAAQIAVGRIRRHRERAGCAGPSSRTAKYAQTIERNREAWQMLASTWVLCMSARHTGRLVA